MVNSEGKILRQHHLCYQCIVALFAYQGYLGHHSREPDTVVVFKFTVIFQVVYITTR